MPYEHNALVTCFQKLKVHRSRGGSNSSIFLNIGETFDPQVVFSVVLGIKNEIVFKYSKTEFLTPYQGSEKRDPPLYSEKLKPSKRVI